ncbi:MAG: hypothetical protein COU34_03510 [Candidatus Magasanikbacteria bacterium CG10_big_fil_rev_8_21_14_0_10_43_9]|nr:MAG: hypothetical protein COU34_03510 [Candidatus Magasanikbacteria bacterium CG10_big_fil_rev_8_21_14_0_10_43_9]
MPGKIKIVFKQNVPSLFTGTAQVLFSWVWLDDDVDQMPVFVHIAVHINKSKRTDELDFNQDLNH